jgi:hypothetical protein
MLILQNRQLGVLDGAQFLKMDILSILWGNVIMVTVIPLTGHIVVDGALLLV